MRGSITDEEQAGAVEPFQDAALYDWEYRRRRNDIAFYRMLADERGGPILDLGCGTGRMAVPLARDGHHVLGVDLSAAMLARAAARVRRSSAMVARRCQLVRADLRALPFQGHFPLAIAAFHTIQHLIDDRDLVALFRQVRRLIQPDGWFVFDVFFPDEVWLARPANRQFDRTVFRHPITKQRLAYTVSHQLDKKRRALHMKLHYQPVDDGGAPTGRGQTVRLCHRQLPPATVETLLRRAGLKILDRWGGFAGEPLTEATETAPSSPTDLDAAPTPTEQHVYLVGPVRPPDPHRPPGRRKPPREP